ncbi:MAG: hypothetical protein KAT65_10010 [Methanophagales archaeon]|nr:hypothetical protein [Methanophagales archaeon]
MKKRKKVKPQTKGQAYSRVFGHLRELSEGQKEKFSFSILQITALVELCELILILIFLALSASGFIAQGLIICSLLVGSFVTNIVWFVLLRREKLADWRGGDQKKMERMSKEQAFKAMTGQLKELYQEQKKRFSYPVLRLTALVELCELILILIVLALSVFGFIAQGLIICSLLVGSFITNIVWLVLMRRAIWAID